MKLTKAERMIGALTVAFLVFLLGYFLGGSRQRGALVVSTQNAPVVREASDAASEPPEQAAGNTRVNLNTASLAELMTLPGIGEVLAQRIIDFRTENGVFWSVDALTDVDGIGEGTLEKLRPYLTVEDGQ